MENVEEKEDESLISTMQAIQKPVPSPLSIKLKIFDRVQDKLPLDQGM